MAEFVASLPAKSVALQDPDLSTPGLQFVYWMQLGQFDLDLLRPKIKSLAGDWSSSYGLFKKGQAATTFTYLTSLVYHWDIEKDFSYDVANFTDGHVAQIEYAAVPDICRSCGLGERFVEFLHEDRSQIELMNKNFMFPMVLGHTVGTSFEKLPKLKILPNQNMDQFVDDQKRIVGSFRNRLGLE
jgi:thiamine transport system substrate-binding protein